MRITTELDGSIQRSSGGESPPAGRRNSGTAPEWRTSSCRGTRRDTGRRAIALAAATIAATLLLPVPATLAAPPIEPSTRIGERGSPLPTRKPTIFERFAGECRLMDPELRWATLPRWAREASLREMLGQLLVVSFLGKTMESASVQETIAALAAGEVGGVIWFGYNVGSRDDVIALNAAFRDSHPRLPALITIDQEGGAVSRLKEDVGVPLLPRARIVAGGSRKDATAAYTDMANAMSTLGFNVNLGPVVDLDVNPDNPVIGRWGRSFGREPETVVNFATAFVDAHRAAGIATALKHFPGHGSTAADSHDGAIDLSRTWSAEEIKPYVEMIKADRADMVMVGHLSLDRLKDGAPQALPATLSRAAITEFLRETLCFDGLVLSDDLKMDAIEAHWTLPEAAILTLKAGSDIVIATVDGEEDGSDTLEQIIDGVAEAAEEDPVLSARIRDAYARVVRFKLDLKSRMN